MKREDIFIRDPFVLVANGKYYLYGTRGENCWTNHEDGVDVYISTDLEEFEGPIEAFHKPEDFWADRNYWAPEVHEYKGAYYMFLSLKAEGHCRGTQIFKADKPEGPFVLHSDGPVTPKDWEALDGTFYISKTGEPYMIFSHEWCQVVDGQICALKLSEDLKEAIGEPKLLFRASEPEWSRACKAGQYVTDGPFMYRTSTGELLMIWSSFAKTGYVVAKAHSDNGEIDGNWIHDEELLFPDNGGHGMIFKNLNGQLFLTIHKPNKHPDERPVFLKVCEKNGTLVSESA
ncbi:MAG: family 43 glycosylhydrolase [Lachnospiraceae bacterium]|nr:family 43 glycosylhydrolase [Lachnospiraceae bacterium]